MSSPPAHEAARSPLRALVLILSLAQTAYWLWAISLAIREWTNPLADGFGVIPAFFATPPFLALSLPALVLSILGLAPRTALALAAAGAVLTPLIVWQAYLAELLDFLF